MMVNKLKLALRSQSLLLWVVLVTVFRIWYLTVNGRALTVDEAQYWSWSQHLAWGYHSKAPMIAWVIHLTTQWLGQTEFAIRLFSPIGFGLASVAVGATGKQLYDEKVGWWAGLTFLSLPSMTFAATLMSTDPLFLLCWAVGFYLFVRAWQEDQPIWWISCGVALGFGLLSKYTTIAFFLSTLIYYFAAGRDASRRRGLLVCAAVSFVMLMPNILWNAGHGYVSFMHVAQHNAAIKGLHFYPMKLLTFFGAQFLVFGPILFAELLYMLRHWRQVIDDPGERLLLAFSFPLLVIMLFEAELSRAYAHWAAPSYIAASIAVSAFMVKNDRLHWLQVSLGIHVLAALLFYCIELAGPEAPTGPALKRLHAYRSAAPEWRAAGKAIGRHFAEVAQPAVLLTDDRVVMVKSYYYAGIPYGQLRMWNPKGLEELQYDTKGKMQSGMHALVVSDNRTPATRMTSRFVYCSAPMTIQVVNHVLSLYDCWKFLGYLAP